MRILVIGGNGFIGSPLVSELLGSGHEVAVFHRRSDVGLADSGAVQIQGYRNRPSDYEGQLRLFSPDVIVDLILNSGEQARQLVETAHEIARGVIAISSIGRLPGVGRDARGRSGPIGSVTDHGGLPTPHYSKALPAGEDEDAAEHIHVARRALRQDSGRRGHTGRSCGALDHLTAADGVRPR
jgi:NAD(P)-dependent dehydrogenase (short-subunit alcohol dehydrogenase family)